MLNELVNTPFGEFFIFFGAALFVIMIGVVPAIMRIRANRNPSPWAFKNPTVESVQNMVGTPIDILKTNEQDKTAVVNIQTNYDNVITLFDENNVVNDDTNGFEHSNIDIAELQSNVDILLNEIENHQNEGFAEIKEKIEFFVGEKTANLITSSLQNIKKGEQVVCGTFLADSLEIEFEGATVQLSTGENIRITEGEYVLIKGNLLPNGEFRVLHWDDPDNIEAGYGIEDFVVKKAV